MKSLYIIFLLSIFIFSCSNHNEEDFFSNDDCETEDVNYLFAVEEIINSKCVTCHASNTNNGIILDDYDNLVMHGDNVVFQINNGSMPPIGWPDLTDCEVEQIQIWYENKMPL